MDYRQEVLRNCPGFETDLIEKKLSLGGLGVAGEAAELLELYADPDHPYFSPGCPPEYGAEYGAKIVKEMGDVYWYLEYLGAALRVAREDCLGAIVDYGVTLIEQRHTAAHISINAGAIADLIKKVLHHEVPLDRRRTEIMAKMGLVYSGLSRMGGRLGFTPEQVMQANVEKLRRRHPNGWTPASQQAKADEAAR